MIGMSTAERLLDFGARMGHGPRAEEQLKGAVAIHNILQREGVAYLADEVGMGKTYVALGAVALFRHFEPGFRVLVIAPRENIQQKWMKEWRNFARFNLRFTDFRNRSIGGHPSRELVACNRLIDFVHETVTDPHRDFFMRLSSFSLGLSEGEDRDSWRKLRDRLLAEVPWLPEGALSLRANKDEFKENFARSVCCSLPVFDLVIVDEGHNLKHGFGRRTAARNRVLALAFGHPSQVEAARTWRDYGPRAKRVLFLSATPLEESYEQIWNQMDVFGKGAGFEALKGDDLDEEEKRLIAERFLIRRVTSMRIAGEQHTRNQYRREWRQGGVQVHDEPITVDDPRQRLVVALVQKKVAELLGSERFNMSFQVGMLASFESFFETTLLNRRPERGMTNFDDPDQTDDELQRQGIDVEDVNRLSRGYRKRFDEEMPHPKMDALVKALEHSWQKGRKSLVFVRRVASVRELKQRLDDCYDKWLISELRRKLPAGTRSRLNRIVRDYRVEKLATTQARAASVGGDGSPQSPGEELDLDDGGGTDSFFAWFFRGNGPKGVISGANIQRRFIQRGTAYATFFEDNFVADLLGVEPGDVTEATAEILGLSLHELRSLLQEGAARYLSRARRHQRADRVEAFQAATVELLKGAGHEIAEQASLVWHERFEASLKREPAHLAPELGDELEVVTFFTKIRRPEWAPLRARLWPEPTSGSFRGRLRERQLRAQVLSTAARLGHALVDLYVLTIQRLGSLELRTLDREGTGESGSDVGAIDDYLRLLEEQRRTPLSERSWGAFDELAEIAAHFDLILDVNAPEARDAPLAETARFFGSLLRQQQPVAGMSGQINRTVVQQFRMPGYPFVLVTTDLLQEGEDLHTFCSDVYHYGISWTPSAMEQRVGRIDRVRSHSDRRLNGIERIPGADEKLQVFYPYLSDTVEILQVNRVLERMNTFLRLMHVGLSAPKTESRTLDVRRELVSTQRSVESITEKLTTAFPIPHWLLDVASQRLAVSEDLESAALHRFHSIRPGLELDLPIRWERDHTPGKQMGTFKLANGRVQPFTLVLRSQRERLVVRCISPVGHVETGEGREWVRGVAAQRPGRIGMILTNEPSTYNLTVEDAVLLGEPEWDVKRLSLLMRRVVETADALEQTRFGDLDQPMRVFKKDLRGEG